MNQYVNKKFNAQYTATIGADFLTKEVTVDDRLVTMQIWDTAGQEKHANIVGSYVKRLDACLMVCDLTNEESIKSIRKWIRDLNNQIQMPVVIVANKSDLP